MHVRTFKFSIRHPTILFRTKISFQCLNKVIAWEYGPKVSPAKYTNNAILVTGPLHGIF